MQTNDTWPRVQTIGVDGFLVAFASALTEPANRAALGFRRAVIDEMWDEVLETSTSLVSTYIQFDLAATDHGTLRARIEALLETRDWYTAPLPEGRMLWRVPTVFGTDLAPQLRETAHLAGFDSEQQAIDSICAKPHRVQTIGFAPGQPYLGQLTEQWDIPRQTALTPRVPEGALVVAIRQIVLFSVTTPTGWRHVGQTALRLFRPERDNPFVLRPGDEVQFVRIDREGYENLRATSPDGGAVCQPVS